MNPPAATLRSVVLAPGQDIVRVQSTMVAAGYRLTATHDLGWGAATARTVWTCPNGGEARLIPDLATGNLVLVLAETATLPPDLACATAADARHLLGQGNPDAVLAGLQIADALGDPALAVALAPHLRSADTVIATAAREALASISGAAVAAVDPDPGAALMSVPGWRAEKLQLLRHLAQGPARGADVLLPLLQRALADTDWEIAVTALLTAARLRLPGLAAAISRARLPSGQRDGVSAEEARFVLALRDAALEHLGQPTGRRLPPGIAAAVAGDGSTVPPTFAPLLVALTLPLTDGPAPPATPGIRFTAGGPMLEDGTLLIWVPPIAHWLGDAVLSGPQSAPPHLHRPIAGFYLSASPIGPMSRVDAQAWLAHMARQTGLAVRLPTSDEWEMAARGPDGRRYAWGCNAAPEARVDLSPWGLAGACIGPGEWLHETADVSQYSIAGGGSLPIRSTRSISASQKAHMARACIPLS